MPLYIGDYLADTSRLTTEQHGAYLLLLMDYWRNGPLPDDDDQLAAITKLGTASWRKSRPVLIRFFTAMDGRLFHKRVESEKKRAHENSIKRSAAGKNGASKRWGKGVANG